MQSPSVAIIRYRLSLFEQSVDALVLNHNVPSGTGLTSASAPYREKCRVRSLLESSEHAGEPYAELWQDYSRIVRNLACALDDCGKEYQDLLLSDLRNYVHAYHAMVCHASLGNACDDNGDGVSIRMLIGELCDELRERYDLSEIERLVSVLDENACTGKDAAGHARNISPTRHCPRSSDPVNNPCLCSRQGPLVQEP